MAAYDLPEDIPRGVGLPAILGLIKTLRQRRRRSYTQEECWHAERLINRAIKRLRSGASRRRRFSGLRNALRAIRQELYVERRR
jgi:hypothetical protein